jgi:uncharacterized protein (TIGR04255 family)
LSKAIRHRAPPINEVGLSVVSSTPGIFDPYDVRGLHSKFNDLPVAERQSTLAALNVAALVGGGSNGFDLATGHPQKWWFVSNDQSHVLQFQEDFFSYNWRRVEAEFGQPVDYPGFNAILSGFREKLQILAEWHASRGSNLPDPSGCELYYEDIIPLQFGDELSFTLSESLTEIDRVNRGSPVAGWSNSWFESIVGSGDQSTSTLKIDINSLGMFDKSRNKPIPILRVTWCAGAARSTWDEVIEFFGIAHDHVLARLQSLISAEVQATWK